MPEYGHGPLREFVSSDEYPTRPIGQAGSGVDNAFMLGGLIESTNGLKEKTHGIEQRLDLLEKEIRELSKSVTAIDSSLRTFKMVFGVLIPAVTAVGTVILETVLHHLFK